MSRYEIERVINTDLIRIMGGSSSISVISASRPPSRACLSSVLARIRRKRFFSGGVNSADAGLAEMVGGAVEPDRMAICSAFAEGAVAVKVVATFAMPRTTTAIAISHALLTLKPCCLRLREVVCEGGKGVPQCPQNLVAATTTALHLAQVKLERFPKVSVRSLQEMVRQSTVPVADA
jgi:hypothetical protein